MLKKLEWAKIKRELVGGEVAFGVGEGGNKEAWASDETTAAHGSHQSVAQAAASASAITPPK